MNINLGKMGVKHRWFLLQNSGLRKACNRVRNNIKGKLHYATGTRCAAETIDRRKKEKSRTVLIKNETAALFQLCGTYLITHSA